EVELAGRLGVVDGERRGDGYDLGDPFGVPHHPLTLEIPGALPASVPRSDAILEKPADLHRGRRLRAAEARPGHQVPVSGGAARALVLTEPSQGGPVEEVGAAVQ